MAKKISKWMPLYVADYLADTSHLNAAEHGGYMLMLMHYWRQSGPLPSDDAQLRRICRMTTREYKNARFVLRSFFIERDGLLHHKRLDLEIKSANERIEKKSKSGKLGADKRWQTHGKANADANGTSIVSPMANGCQTDAPSPSPSPFKKDIGARKRATRIDPDWKLSEKGNQYALSRGLSAEQIPGEAEHFKDHHLARGSVFADWEAAWRTWVKNAIKFAGKSASRPSQAQPQSVSRGPDDDQLAWLIRKGMRSPSGPSSADCARLARAGKVTLADAARYAMMTAAEFTERFGVSERTAA